MFSTLSESLQKTFKSLRGYGKLSEKNVKDGLREVRLAMLEADVHFQVTKDFISRVRESCLGEEVLNSVTPGQQIVKRVNDELVHLLGDETASFTLNCQPAQIMMLGLHGAGKTTTSSKLALHFKNKGKRVLLVACDIRRPAAVDQLRILSEQIDVPCLLPEPGEAVPRIGKRAKNLAAKKGIDVVIYDTGGRLQMDSELVTELEELKAEVSPENTVLVLDAAIGQESVDVAQRFNEAVGLTGLILTKMDGDARGGAALSVRAVTGCPVLMLGTGEKPEDLETFHPDRMASRILGMGDVVSFVEKAQQSVDMEQIASMEEKMRTNQLDLEDFLLQLQQMKKLGPMEGLLDMMPGMPKINAATKAQLAEQGGKEAGRAEAIIQSMTPYERKNPKNITASRKKRIARGSGTEVRHVNDLLKKFDQTRNMSKNFKKMQKRLLRMGR
jgi:signal recognition particle subunit SRP54